MRNYQAQSPRPYYRAKRIDPLRETRVMGLKTRFRNLRNILADGEAQTREMLVLESPVLTNGMFERFEKYVGKKALTIDCTFPMPDITATSGEALHEALQRIREDAVAAVKDGVENIVLSDQNVDDARAAVPMILAVGAAQTHLVKNGLRSSCSILVRSAECVDTHYFPITKPLLRAGC